MSVNCPGGTLYTIKAGDTFFALAARYGVTVQAIIAANPNVNPDNLQIGQVICIPPKPAPDPCPGGTLYTIKAGDTLFALANTYGVTVQAIIAANPNINPNNLQIGQVICIPPKPAPDPCPGATAYTIKAGDTLYALGLRYGVTVNAILAANPGLDPNNLRIGQVICIPPRVTPPSPRPRVIVLNPTAQVPNSKAWLGVETELGTVVGTVTNVPAPTTFPGGYEVYKLWVKVPGQTTWHVTTMAQSFPGYWVGRVAPGVPLTGSEVVISAEKIANGTSPQGVSVATGVI